VVTLSGRIDGNFGTVAGATLSPGCVYFLDSATAGNITTSEPTTVGYVSKPVMIGLGETAGIVVQYRGNYLNSTSVGSGLSGSNIIYVSFPKSPNPLTLGFTGGVFLSYAPQIAGPSAGITYFNKLLVDTGRTAINNGWFISGSKNFISRLYSPGTPYYTLPWEDDFVIGMIQSVITTPGAYIMELVTRGYSTVVPLGISSLATSTQPGIYYLSGATYTVAVNGVTGQVVAGVTSSDASLLPVYQLGYCFVGGKPTPSWYVNVRPMMNTPTTSTYRSAALPQTLTNGSNKTFNGDFSIWQRDAGNKSGAYTSYGSLYFADNWIRRQSGFVSSSTSSQNLQRQTFPITSTSVEGNPNYYLDIKCLESLSSTLDSTNLSNPVYSVGHVIDNIQTFSGSSITVSFYAKTTVYDANYTATVYLSRYGNGSLQEKLVIGQITPQTNWTKHTLNYNVPAFTGVGTFTNDYVEIGIDLNPTIRAAYKASVASSTNITISLASFCVYEGSFSSPPHMFLTKTEKLNLAERYYYSTYSDSQTVGSQTMLSPSEPTLNAYSFTYLPNTPFGTLKLPATMRTASTSVSVYSPFSGVSNQMFNYTAALDLKDTSGTRGYNGASRIAPLNTQVVSTKSDDSTVRVNLNAGGVPYDVINCHLIVDGSYPI
jgi:hypothetical protein